MPQLTLKSILGKRSEITTWLNAWSEITKSLIAVEDVQHGYLFGTPEYKVQHTFSVSLDEDLVGYVHGDNNDISLVADLLSLTLKKEAEKKKLGTEVLNLYQELNVIYNFSEKLSETIDPDIIAQLTLEQAMHSISADSGVVVLWDGESQKLLIPAASGESFLNLEQISSQSAVLLKIGFSGQSEIMGDLHRLKEKNIIHQDVKSVIYAAMKVKHHTLGAIILVSQDTEKFSAAHLKLLVTLALQSSSAIESAMLYEKNIREVREREEAILKIHEVTKKFVPNEFILSLGKATISDVRLGDQVKKIVTVLFTDIRDFTTISEKMTPEENFRFVSAFNERLGPVIRANHGFINQYLGDSIMAIFPRNPDDALNAAIGMQKAIFNLNIEREFLGLPPLKAGIGMHTGPLIMGITGDEHRLDAATISDTVNTSSRIESLTKYYQTAILLSDETLKYIPNIEKFHFRNLGKVLLKGKNNLLTIFECLNGYDDETQNIRISTVAQFNEALKLYQGQQFQKAKLLYQDILLKDPEDYTARKFIKKSENYLQNGPPENWTGADEMLSK